MVRVPKIGERKTGSRPKQTPEGTKWVPVGPVHPEKGRHQLWELQKIRTVESDLNEAPFIIPPELGGEKEATQSTFLDKIENPSGGVEKE